MACNCENTTCLEIIPVVLDCDSSITVALEADETATWLMSFEFNGRWFGESISVTNGENLALPNLFNETYKHTIKFYKADKTLVNDTCYTLDMSTAMGSGVAPTPAPDLGYLLVEIEGDITTVDNADDTYYNAWLETHEITEITTNGQSYLVGESFTQDGGFVTWTNGGSWYIGQIVKFEE